MPYDRHNFQGNYSYHEIYISVTRYDSETDVAIKGFLEKISDENADSYVASKLRSIQFNQIDNLKEMADYLTDISGFAFLGTCDGIESVSVLQLSYCDRDCFNLDNLEICYGLSRNMRKLSMKFPSHLFVAHYNDDDHVKYIFSMDGKCYSDSAKIPVIDINMELLENGHMQEEEIEDLDSIVGKKIDAYAGIAEVKMIDGCSELVIKPTCGRCGKHIDEEFILRRGCGGGYHNVYTLDGE